jgi:hypothetical protein
MSGMVLLLLLCVIHRSQGQNLFNSEDIPCPMGENITLDTLSYAPDKPMPFDRCFYLKLTLHENINLAFFAITPLTRHGKIKNTRRDYRIFLRDPRYAFTKATKREMRRRSFRYSVFRDLEATRLYSSFSMTPKAEKSEIVLKVPPLDPGREYRITFVSHNGSEAEEFLTVGKLMSEANLQHQGRLGIAATPAAAPSLVDEAYRRLSRLESQRQATKHLLDLPTRATVVNDHSAFTLEFNRIADVKEYRVFISPVASPLSLPVALGIADTTYYYRRFRETGQHVDPEKLKIRFPLRFTTGTKLDLSSGFDFTGDGYYVIQVLGLPNNTLQTLGTLWITHLGSKIRFTPAIPIPGEGRFIRVNGRRMASYRTIFENDSTIAAQQTYAYTCTHNDLLTFALDEAAQCPCKEKGIIDLTQKNELMNTIAVLANLTTAEIDDLQLGLISLKDPASRLGNTAGLDKRIANLEKSISLLNSLITFLEILKTHSDPPLKNYNNLRACLDNLKDNLINIKTPMSANLSIEEQLKRDYINSYHLYKIEPVSIGSTSVLNFASSSKLRIVPDFGFVGVLKGDGTADFQDLVPYLGFQINFRPLDKNIPFRMIRNRSWRHYLSFFSGLTLTSIRIPGKRENFFGSNSLLMGLGFRVNNYFKITSGGLFFRAIDTNPLSEQRPVRSSPFVGISMDLEIQELFGGIKKLFL